MRLGINRIIKIACVLTIDGDEWKLPEIDAGCGFTRIDTVAEGLCLAQRLCRKLVRQTKRAIADSVATSTGRSGSRRFSIRAWAEEAEPAWRVMRAMTQSPWRAPCKSCGVTAHRNCRRRSAAFTQALRP